MLRTTFVLIATMTAMVGCKQQTPPAASAPAETAAATAAPPAPAITELVKTDTIEGSGTPIASGQMAVVHYTGWLYDAAAPDHKKGAPFDSSRARGPFSFPVGGGQVIAGWDQGVVGMKVGGQRTLIIPSDLAYGDGGRGPIPPSAPLIFEVELLEIK